MNRKGEALLASALCTTTFIAGCSPEKPGSDIPDIFAPTSETPTTPAPEYVPPPEPGELTRALLAKDAPVRLIFVPVIRQLKVNQLEAEDKSYTKKLLANDKKTLDQIADSFEDATANRYKPSRITVVKTGTMAINACLNSADWKQHTAIDAHVAKYRDDTALNVLVVDQYGCESVAGGSRTGGYADDDLDPIMTATSLTAPDELDSGFPRSVNHETGHSAGADHAGTSDCTDILKIQHCKISPTFDTNSLMGYQSTVDSNDFTNPELFKLGLLDKTEIIDNPQSGTYEIVDAHAKGAKVLRIPAQDKTLYFSWEKSEDAVDDTLCKPIKSDKDYELPNLVSSGTREINGKEVTFVCYAVNKTGTDHSVQVRYDDVSTEFPSSVVVTRPDRALDKFEDELRDTGENKPNTLLYRDEQLEVKMVGRQGNTKATIQVTRK